MTAATKFYAFTLNLGKGVHNWPSAQLKIALCPSAPSLSAVALSELTQIAAGGGYTTGGAACTYTSWTQSSGLSSLVVTDPPLWTATTGGMAAFRYAVLYDHASGGGITDALIGFWDYGQSLALADTETFQADLTGAVVTIS